VVNSNLRFLLGIIIFLILFFSCEEGIDNSTQIKDDVDVQQNPEKDAIEDSYSQNEDSQKSIDLSVTSVKREIPKFSNLSTVLWETEMDILNGGITGVVANSDGLWVTGMIFDTDAYSEVYELYSQDPTQSIHKYYADFYNNDSLENFSPGLGLIVNADFAGAVIQKKTIKSTGRDRITDPFIRNDQIYYSFLSHEGFIYYNAIFGSDENDFSLIGEYEYTTSYRERLGSHLFEPFTNNSLDGDLGTAAYYDLSLGNDDPNKKIFDWPLKEYNNGPAHTQIIYDSPTTIYASSNSLEIILDKEEGIQRINNFSYELPILADNYPVYGTYYNGQHYVIGNFNQNNGIFWSFDFDPEADTRNYNYLDQQGLFATQMLVEEDKVLVLGSNNDQLIILVLNHEGDIVNQYQWGQGRLTGIYRYEGRLYVAGWYKKDYPDEPEEYGNRFMYLAEIQIN
jgi:hypothetical protein